jgi:L-rhamnose isomerase/sugar isomerase
VARVSRGDASRQKTGALSRTPATNPHAIGPRQALPADICRTAPHPRFQERRYAVASTFTQAQPIDGELVAAHNARRMADLARDYEVLGERLARGGVDIETVKRSVAAFRVAIPSWGVGTGGTRFARFPGPGEPRNVHDKLQDCAVIAQLVRCTSGISLHFPWDWVADFAALRDEAAALGLHFDAVNSNTFQDQPGATLSYKFGSLSHTDPAVRAAAIEHNLACIAAGEALGSRALTVWIGDGSSFPGQQHFRRSFERYITSARAIYAALPDDWHVYLEHKLFEPAFYSTVIQDWGSSLLAAQALGPKARCLVDLGHHAPTVNIEMIVARLIACGKLAGFHFNDSKYGDDDLDSGSIQPYRLFLVFNELADAVRDGVPGFDPAYMLDQSHNVTDPIESLMMSAATVQRTYAQALLVDRAALDASQQANDPLMATQTLKTAFETDVSPIVQRVRLEAGGAIDPVAVYRASEYRRKVAETRPRSNNLGGGII